ncbi:MAG: hypothetical protein IJK56_04040 [Firmicutes bacterium]|nr:hypothetical protein [Bacillota bacterium]
MIEYSPLDFNKNGDISQLELAAAHQQAEETGKAKRTYNPAIVTLSVGLLIIAIASVGVYGGISGGHYKIINQDSYWSPDYPMIIICGLVIAAMIFLIIRMFVRQYKKSHK